MDRDRIGEGDADPTGQLIDLPLGEVLGEKDAEGKAIKLDEMSDTDRQVLLEAVRQRREMQALQETGAAAQDVFVGQGAVEAAVHR